MTQTPGPAGTGPEGTGLLSSPPDGAMAAYPRPATARPHILVVNGRKVRQPVFVLGAPCSGTAILARALKRTSGFHMTLGQRWVLPVVHGFARNPGLYKLYLIREITQPEEPTDGESCVELMQDLLPVFQRSVLSE